MRALKQGPNSDPLCWMDWFLWRPLWLDRLPRSCWDAQIELPLDAISKPLLRKAFMYNRIYRLSEAKLHKAELIRPRQFAENT